jgi:hypothetical protein
VITDATAEPPEPDVVMLEAVVPVTGEVVVPPLVVYGPALITFTPPRSVEKLFPDAITKILLLALDGVIVTVQFVMSR